MVAWRHLWQGGARKGSRAPSRSWILVAAMHIGGSIVARSRVVSFCLRLMLCSVLAGACGWTWRTPVSMTRAMGVADTARVLEATPTITPVASPQATPTAAPTILPPLVGVQAGTVVISATIAATGTFFLSTHVNGLRIGLRVPPHAVRGLTQFRIVLATLAPPVATTCVANGGVGLGNAYDFMATQVASRTPVRGFSQSLLIRMDVALRALKAVRGCDISLAYRHGSAWVAVAGSHVDMTTGAVTGLTDHFTVFQVRAVARAQPHHVANATPRSAPTIPSLLPRTPTPTPGYP